jgi:large conductance mechanosensitive channel
MIKEFVGFLKEYQVIGLAIAVLIGSKVNELVKSVVDHLVMPILGIFIPSGNWRELAVEIGGAKFGIGAVLGSLVDFAIVAVLVFLFAKVILREVKVAKK